MRRVAVVAVIVVAAVVGLLLLVQPLVPSRTPRGRITIDDGRPIDHPIRVAKESVANAVAPLLALFHRPMPIDLTDVSSSSDGSIQLTLSNTSNEVVTLYELELPIRVARRLGLAPPSGFREADRGSSTSRVDSDLDVQSVLWVGGTPLGQQSSVVISIPAASAIGYFEATMRFRNKTTLSPTGSIRVTTTLQSSPSRPA